MHHKNRSCAELQTGILLPYVLLALVGAAHAKASPPYQRSGGVARHWAARCQG